MDLVGQQKLFDCFCQARKGSTQLIDSVMAVLAWSRGAFHGGAKNFGTLRPLARTQTTSVPPLQNAIVCAKTEHMPQQQQQQHMPNNPQHQTPTPISLWGLVLGGCWGCGC
eukprot:TRINITY_DN9191_c0_g1_i2.p4 TRINITY_DN9191_c0_g1~~TRINITY_DN9191_c0_g1_i2.p4  ORF type:complete len:111 (-),score=9.60 TRINITY_DN9191_c0_g1_i2:52-384(-)